jgi:hypothetical protein
MMSQNYDDFRDDFFWVIQRCIDDEQDIVRKVGVAFIKEVPKDIQERNIRELLEQAGRFSHDQWKEYKVLPRNSTDYDSYAEDMDDTTYYALLKETQEEKRVTLRLPVGLHAALTKAAKHLSFNQLCINLLSDAIGYSAKIDAKQNN